MRKNMFSGCELGSAVRQFCFILGFGVLGYSAAAEALTFQDFKIPTGDSGPRTITAGPDGALWFIENFANQIGRITTAGTFTEFPIPTKNSGVSGIASGPDGALWFTEAIGQKIGRITT